MIKKEQKREEQGKTFLEPKQDQCFSHVYSRKKSGTRGDRERTSWKLMEQSWLHKKRIGDAGEARKWWQESAARPWAVIVAQIIFLPRSLFSVLLFILCLCFLVYERKAQDSFLHS